MLYLNMSDSRLVSMKGHKARWHQIDLTEGTGKKGEGRKVIDNSSHAPPPRLLFPTDRCLRRRRALQLILNIHPPGIELHQHPREGEGGHGGLREQHRQESGHHGGTGALQG